MKAEDYEAVIVVAWYKYNGLDFDSKKTGVTPKIYSDICKNPKLIENALPVVKKILNTFPHLKGLPAEQFGRASSKTTLEWKNYGATNNTPKTDILIGDIRFSLKMGSAHIMSGGVGETLSTLHSAYEKCLEWIGGETETQFQKVVSILNSFVQRGLCEGEIRPLIKSGSNEEVNRGETAHKQIMVELKKLFEMNPNFKLEFAREGMSGQRKFGERSLAAAEYMLVVSDTGVTINSIYDDAYVRHIADIMRLQARYKSTSRKIKGKKTGERYFWSVVSLIVNV